MDKATERVLQRAGLVDLPSELAFDPDLYPFYHLLNESDFPEDVFGFEDISLPIETLQRYLKKEYETLKACIAPENYTDPHSVEIAEEINVLLDRFYDQGAQRILQQVYGMSGYNRVKPLWAKRSFSVDSSSFYVGPQLLSGDTYSVYQGYMEKDSQSLGEVTIKLTNSLELNSRTQNEINILDVLHKVNVPQWKHLPLILARFKAEGKIGIIQRKISGFTLSEVRKHQQHKKGVDQKHIVWMLDRLFSALGYVHSQGVVHGNISPEHILIQPSTHNILLCGWSSAVHNPALTKERVATHSGVFSAPEVRQKAPVGPWSDIYSVGKVMIWALGGDPETNTLSDTIESPIKDFLLSLVKEAGTARPSDAWELYHEQCAIKDSLWPRKFLNFDMS